MSGAFTSGEESTLKREMAQGKLPACPRCRGRLDASPVSPEARVAYVRYRTILHCPACGIRCVIDRD